MKILSLIIKQKYFDAILQGRKVQEFRELRPKTISRYVQLDDEGYEILDENENSIPIKYDAIRFYVGYNKNRDTALVEVKDARTEIFLGDDGKPIEFVVGKDEINGNDVWWVAQQIVYDLGKVLEYQLKGGEIIKP